MTWVMWPHPDPDQALSFAVVLCAIGQLIGLAELQLVRGELSHGGFLDWTMIGNLSPRARTRPGSRLRREFRRLSSRSFAALVVVDAAVAAALLLRPASVALIAAAIVLQVVVLKRHHMTIDGSDQMMLVVLAACLLGRIAADPIGVRAAVTFLAAELVLAYLVAGISKTASSYWRTGVAFPIIAQTRMYGHPLVARLVRDRPVIGRAASYAVFGWESLCFLALTAPRGVVVAMLVIGIGFHVGCAVVMGLNRFVWAFVAGYPALLCTNIALRADLGAPTANAITIVAGALGALPLIAAVGWRPATGGGLIRADTPPST